MKKLLCILLTLALLASLCVPAFADEPDYTTGTPWLCVDLVGVVTEDTPTDLKDNFALAVNKDKLLATEIPEGYSSGGTMAGVRIQSTEDIRNMFLGDAPEGHDARLAYDLFKLMMDWDSRNTVGVAPLKTEVDALEAVDSIAALTDYFINTPLVDQVSALWSSGSTQDLIDSNRYVLAVAEATLLMGDSAEYEAPTDYGLIKREAYGELARKMLEKLGYTGDEAAAKLENCLAFEGMIAPVLYTSEEQQRPDFFARILNYLSLDEFRELQGNLPILDILKIAGYPEAEEYLIMNPAFIEQLNELYTDENLTLIKDYLIVHGVLNQADGLDRECYEWVYECSNAVSGAEGMLDDDVVFSSDVADILAWPVAELYTATYLKQEDKDRISAMVDELLAHYHGIIGEAGFLSDETKAAAIEKLDSIEKRILFPDSWEKYSCEELNFAGPEDGGTLWDASRAINEYYLAESVRDYLEPVDKTKWDETPQTFNCFYDPQNNSVAILGAFARGDIYNSAMSDEELLAKLGAVIGHEISHAFDSSGAQFDKNGDMADWWTEEDYLTFLARNEKMVDYYNAIQPWAGQELYGSIMTGEAGADMAGVKVALRAAAEIEGFDYDAFFRAYADLWAGQETLQSIYAGINDVHPLSYLRINCTLQQFDEFLDCYGITEGDGMYLAPAERVNIW